MAENELHDQELVIYKDSAICGDQVDFPLLRQSSEIMRTSRKLREMIYKIRNIVKKMAIFGVQDSLLAKDNELIWKKSLEILEDQISIGLVLSLRINPRISSIIEECAHYLRSFVHTSLATLKHK
jgi:hypothetical protein